MVAFFRFGSVSSSKSQLINSLINEKHNTFFHRNCAGSSRTRILMDGVVEIAWYCPFGEETDTFPQCVAFCNLHGDAGVNEKQLDIITQMSSVNVVILPQLNRNDESMTKIHNFYMDSKPLICLLTENDSELTEICKGKYKMGLKDRNQSDVFKELRRAVNNGLSSLESSSLFKLEDVAEKKHITVDEKTGDCRRGKDTTQRMMSLLENKDPTVIKELFLPCQGKLWHQWCQNKKELHKSTLGELHESINIEKIRSDKKTKMQKIREQQETSDLSQFIKIFINELNSLKEKEIKYFLKWLGILLDDYTTESLSALHHEYDKKWSAVLDLKKKHDKSQQLTAEQELERISEKLQAATFGLEHILREVGQIYESCSSVKKNKKDIGFNFRALPGLAAKMMMSGFPLELLDGDAAHVPLIWVTAVFDELVNKLGDKRVFVLSVLGIQSSGKSTMLNVMFGLQFGVSAGRCTRGAFMQLVKVSDEMKEQLKFDYILVVDTEGLRALELNGRSTRNHDNEMATFVVGLGNMTLVNIFGENTAEMQDTLQIVVQAFLRMKKIRLDPSCMFVHQNVSDVTAGEKNMEGRRRLQKKLDEMTKLAAKEENCDTECFSDVIAFDVHNDVKYFAQLWEGSTPMAPPNPKYSRNIQELKDTILSKSSRSSGITLSQFKMRINDLWTALLNENFAFSFKNTLEISVYRRLETRYSDWTWSLRSAMLSIEDKFYNRIANGNIEVHVYEFMIDLCLHACDIAKGKFTEHHKEFKESNDPRNYLEKQKTHFYSIFKNYCSGPTSTTILINFICSKLEPSILEEVYKKNAIDLAAQMRSDIQALRENRQNLEKHILKSLAEKDDFKQYIQYIHQPKEHFKQFITTEVNKYFTEQGEIILNILKGNLEQKEQIVSNAEHAVTEEVKNKRGDGNMWFTSFTQTLTDKLKFTGEACVDLTEIKDLDFLGKHFSDSLNEVMTKLQNRFSSIDDIKMEKCRKKPDEILIDHFCQCCWVQCPFCKAICTNTMENHSGDHTFPFHRNTGLNGWFYRRTTNLSHCVCTTAVASNQSFHPNSSEHKVLWKEYRKGGPKYVNWSITPDLSELPYWKWFVCRFQKDLEKYYNKTFQGYGEIPDEWRQYTKEDAIESLDKYL